MPPITTEITKVDDGYLLKADFTFFAKLNW